jgi:integrase
MSQRIHVWVTHFGNRNALQLQWIEPDTGLKRTRSARTSSEAEAEARRVDLEADLNAGRHREPCRLSWSDFRQRFETEYLSGLRRNTRLGYRDTFRAFERLSRPTVLRGLSEQTVSAFAAALRTHRTKGRGDGLAPSSIRLHLEHLHTALTWACRQKLISAVPEFPVVKVPRRRPRPVASELYERLSNRAPDQQTRTCLACGWLDGLRLGEAHGLQWDETEVAPWVDFARRRIWFPAAGAKAAEDQWVPLDPQLAEMLRALPRSGPTVFRFLAPDGHPISANALSGRIVRLAKRAGVRLSMHSLRKGFISRHAAAQPAQVVQRLARHADIRTTLDHYASIDAAVEAAIFGDGNDPGSAPAPSDAECLKNHGEMAPV